MFEFKSLNMKYWSWWARKRETIMTWKKNKNYYGTVIPKRGEKENLGEPQSDFPLKMDNYIRKRRIVIADKDCQVACSNI